MGELRGRLIDRQAAGIPADALESILGSFSADEWVEGLRIVARLEPEVFKVVSRIVVRGVGPFVTA